MASPTKVISDRYQAPAPSGAHGEIVITILDANWSRHVPRVNLLITRAMKAAGVAGHVVLVDDQNIRDLNLRHRGKNRPTNVLTYTGNVPEIVVGFGITRREAAVLEKPIAHHLLHLVIHGALHVSGYEHDHPGDARRMEMRETRLLRRLGLPAPSRRL